MKRLLALTSLCLCLMCGAAAETLPGRTLTAMLGRTLTLLTTDTGMFTYHMNQRSQERSEQQIAEIAAGTYTQPAHAFLLTNPAGAGDSAEAALLRVTWPFDTVDELFAAESRSTGLLGLLASVVNEGGVSHEISGTVDDRIFAAPGVPDGCGILFLVYADGAPYVLPWYAENGAVRLRGVFLPQERLAECDSAGELTAWLKTRGVTGVDVAECAWDARSGSDSLDISDRSGTPDMTFAPQLALRMEASLCQTFADAENGARVTALAEGHDAAPHLVVIGDPSQNLISFGMSLSTFGKPEVVKRYVHRYYERQAVESIATINYARGPEEDDSLLYLLNTGAAGTLIFADGRASGSGVAILLYEDALPLCVYWYAENGAVRMDGWFGDASLGQCRSAAEVTRHLLQAQQRYVSIQFREVTE